MAIDPVCGMEWKPKPGVELCSTQKAGDACTTEGATCDLKSNCGQLLLCAKSDPLANGACPISLARWKTDIRYLDDARRREMAADDFGCPCPKSTEQTRIRSGQEALYLAGHFAKHLMPESGNLLSKPGSINRRSVYAWFYKVARLHN